MTRLRAAFVAAAVLLAMFAAASPASASANLHVTYHATGTSTIASTGSKVKLGPATLSLALHPDGTFTGALPLPSATSNFKIMGAIPATATVHFVPKGKVTGALKAGKRVVVTSKAKDYLRLSDVKVAGVDQMVGDSCRTAKPVALSVATPKGKSFNLDKGGVLKGTFTIGDFAGCGSNPLTAAINDTLINKLVPGSGNTISLTLSHGKLVH
jgi:hypothetical protein